MAAVNGAASAKKKRLCTDCDFYGRINKTDFASELLVTIDIYFHGYRSALLHFGKVAFGYVDV